MSEHSFAHLGAAWRRLFEPHPAEPLQPGCGRALVLSVGRPADWSLLAPLWSGVQSALQLPAPLIAVDGVDAMQLWFALERPVPEAEAAAWLASAVRRWLPDLPAHRLRTWPPLPAAGAPAPTDPAARSARSAATAATAAPGLVDIGEALDQVDALDAADPGALLRALHPAADRLTGWALPTVPQDHGPGDDGEPRWSAFVAPDLAPLFSDTPWLDLPPGDDGQARLLAALRPVRAQAWRVAADMLAMAEAVAVVAAPAPAMASIPSAAASQAGATAGRPGLQPAAAPVAVMAAAAPVAEPPPSSTDARLDDLPPTDDPQVFLRAVMNARAAPLAQRIEAARLLLEDARSAPPRARV
ncbi:hypothetical protein [Pseudaquabacterium rugosum]|uniref:Uncharacterized protein n=1 Tax=Pseudaquabacterium rugosum TaxID=2984194 RepID=A0ABU9BH90_9BURK